MSDTCRAWARFRGMSQYVRCQQAGGHVQRRSPAEPQGIRHLATVGDDRWSMMLTWTDDAPGLETGYEEEA